jgi:glycerophosphoryl diester phosphodiesterase
LSHNLEVIGHRGWPTRYQDNTLPGFISAAPLCDGVEMDVRRSVDGKLALAHDTHLGHLEVSSTPWSLLSEVDLGHGAKPCLLDEALAALPDTSAFIEIKNTPGEHGYEPDHRLALEAAALSRPTDVIVSFNWASVNAVRLLFPDTLTGLNVGVFGSIDEAIRYGAEAGHRYLIPDVDLVMGSTTPIPEEFRVAVWSTRSGETFEASIEELVSRGVSGIITDDPPNTRDLIGRFR